MPAGAADAEEAIAIADACSELVLAARGHVYLVLALTSVGLLDEAAAVGERAAVQPA
jgi:hypothetical protein